MNQSSEKKVHNVIIIGSGPAGYTAALYAARANLEPILFTGPQPGGQLMLTTEVENYPGFPDGVMGPEMMDIFRRQTERFSTKIFEKQITKVDFNQHPFKLTAEDDENFFASTVIISTGASAKWLGIPSETTFSGYGVSACATCDGFFFRNKEVIVVGGGDTAMEDAIYLSKLCKKVYIVHRRDAFRASKIMQDRAMSNPKIEIIWNAVVDQIIGELEPAKKVTGVLLRNTITGENSKLPIEGVFIAIGHQPNTAIFKEWLETDDLGYLKVEPFSTRTKIPGVFAAGDVTDRIYRQAVTAAGMGCMAALDAARFLEAEEH